MLIKGPLVYKELPMKQLVSQFSMEVKRFACGQVLVCYGRKLDLLHNKYDMKLLCLIPVYCFGNTGAEEH